MVAFLLLAFFSYASASGAVARFATTAAYEKELKKEIKTSENEAKTLDYTQLEFAEFSVVLAKSGANSAALLCIVCLFGSVLSGIELILLRRT